MKPALVLFISVVSMLSYGVWTASVKDLVPRSPSMVAERVRSAANVIADAVVQLLRQHVVDPLVLPDARKNFTLEIWVVKFDGVLYLTNGWLRDLKTMVRSGEADVQFDGDLVHITTNLDFNTLHLNYDYRVTVMGLEPSGKLLGAAEDLRLALHLTADLSTFKTTLSSLNVLNAANTEVEVQGGGAQDEIVNAIIRLVKPYFEQDILNILEDKITSTLEEALIDFDIGEILGL